MSVQTQIDRISGAVSSALTALSEKGVTVPDGTKVDGLAALIAAIEAGGGSGGGALSGTFKLAAYSDTIPLGVPIPDDNFFIVVLPSTDATSANNLGSSYLFHGSYTKINGTVDAFVQGTSATSKNSSDWTIDKSAGTAKIKGKYIKENYEYRWFMGALA